MMAPTKSYDWAALIDQLMAAGVSTRLIGAAMECMLTDRMIHHYRRGVQPLHWRGELLLTFWAQRMGLDREAAPTCSVVRGHRVENRTDTGPRVQSLPAWPVVVPVSCAPGVTLRKKPGPKPKMRAAA